MDTLGRLDLDGSTDKNLPYFVVENLAALTGMGDRLWAGLPPHASGHIGQLSLLRTVGCKMNTGQRAESSTAGKYAKVGTIHSTCA